MIKSFIRRSASPLLARLDRIQAGVDQVNRDGSKSSDPARDLVMLSLRDSVSLLGVTTARLSEQFGEAPDPGLDYVQSVAIASLGRLTPGDRVVVLGDAVADRVAEAATALGLDTIRASISSAASLSLDGAAALAVLADRLPHPPTAEGVRDLPARVIVGVRLDDAGTGADMVRSIAHAVGADDGTAARLADLAQERDYRGAPIVTAVLSS